MSLHMCACVLYVSYIYSMHLPVCKRCVAMNFAGPLARIHYLCSVRADQLQRHCIMDIWPSSHGYNLGCLFLRGHCSAAATTGHVVEVMIKREAGNIISTDRAVQQLCQGALADIL